MNKNTYLIIAVILSIILIVLIMNNNNDKSNQAEHLENTNNNDLDKYIASDENKLKIKLKWINPDNNMTYYLGAIPKEKIDKKCGAFDYVNKNEFTSRPDGTNPGVNIKAEYILLLVNQYYIQQSNCKDKKTCVSSKFDESYFNFMLKERNDNTDLVTPGKSYQLEYMPENKDDSYFVTYAKNVDLLDDAGDIQQFGRYIRNLSLVKKSKNSIPPKYSKIARPYDIFNIEQTYNKDGTFKGFKMFFDKVPIYKNDNAEIDSTSRKYVGFLVDNPPCFNTDCQLETCTSSDKQCIKCCSIDHRYLTLYDKVFNKKDQNKTVITTFIPEFSELFNLRYDNATNNCAYEPSDVAVDEEECQVIYD
jgi:hypothetical protein